MRGSQLYLIKDKQEIFPAVYSHQWSQFTGHIRLTQRWILVGFNSRISLSLSGNLFQLNPDVFTLLKNEEPDTHPQMRTVERGSSNPVLYSSHSPVWREPDPENRNHPVSRVPWALPQQPQLCLENPCSGRLWNPGKITYYLSYFYRCSCLLSLTYDNYI